MSDGREYATGVAESADLFEARHWLNAMRNLNGRRLRKYRAECIARSQAYALLAIATALEDLAAQQRPTRVKRETT